ncbi:TPA: hypothetical protein I8Y21_003851 [Klebsiella oxytoca]|uniref:Uncharacterized protein n=1 Tax=Klebsiella oxytoca TaxID=571 RepID=A0AAN5LB20_KLEOX|nr:hypothetical protein [Klebsiella oxytoca]
MKQSECKEITVSQNVRKELHDMALRINELCKENNMPYVFSYIDERRNTGAGVLTSKYNGAYQNHDSGAWDTSITAASIIARIDDVPDWILNQLSDVVEEQENATENHPVH